MKSESNLLWDKTFKLIRINGSGVRKFLNGQTSLDIFSFQDRKIFRTCWLNCIGRVRAIIEARIYQDSAELIVLSGDIDELEGS